MRTPPLAVPLLLLLLLAAAPAAALDIDARWSGSWYDPSHSGEGFVLQVIDDTSAAVYWFTYEADGRQRWFIGVGAIQGDRIVVPLLRTRGGRFGPDYDPAQVQYEEAGVLTLDFDDCNSGGAQYLVDDRPGSQDLVRLAGVGGLGCADAGAKVLSGGHSGSWYDPTHSGEGFALQMLADGSTLVYWFSYTPDGEQAWMVGLAPQASSVFEVSLAQPVGGRFGRDFDPADVVHVPFGSARFLLSCELGRIDHEPVLEGYAADMQVLVRLLRLAGASCDDGVLPLEVAADEGLAIVDVTVLTQDPEAPRLEHQTVVVADGAIVSVGPTAATTLPAGSVLVDGRGRYLMPGLVDTHTHHATNVSELTGELDPVAIEYVGAQQKLLYLANGVTTLVNLGDFGEPLPRWAAESLDPATPGPRIVAAQYARGGAGTCDGGPANRTVTAANARAFTQQAHAQGYALMKLYNCTPDGAVPEILSEAEALGMPVAGHLPTTVDERALLSSGRLDLLGHSEAYMWSILDFRQDPALIPDAVALTLQGGTAVSTTLHIVELIAQVWCRDSAGIAAYWARPDTAYMHWTERSLHARGINGTRWAPANCRVDALDPYQAFVKRIVLALHEGGVPLLLGTDSPTVLGVAGFSAHDELLALSRAGIGNRDVLAIATRQPGDFLRERLDAQLRIGRVAEGYAADLLLLDADPEADLSAVEDARVAVIARGHWRSAAYFEPLLEAIRIANEP